MTGRIALMRERFGVMPWKDRVRRECRCWDCRHYHAIITSCLAAMFICMPERWKGSWRGCGKFEMKKPEVKS